MERGETTQDEMCPMAHGWALESLDRLCPTSVYGVSFIHSFPWSLIDKGGWDLALVIALYAKVCWFLFPQLITKKNSPQKNALLTMIGMVLALERICLTKRYLSYNGFITCRSFLVTWKKKQHPLSVQQIFHSIMHVPVIAVSQRGLEGNFMRMTG